MRQIGISPFFKATRLAAVLALLIFAQFLLSAVADAAPAIGEDAAAGACLARHDSGGSADAPAAPHSRHDPTQCCVLNDASVGAPAVAFRLATVDRPAVFRQTPFAVARRPIVTATGDPARAPRPPPALFA